MGKHLSLTNKPNWGNIVNPLLDKGFKLTMEADRGALVNEQTGVFIGVD